MNVFSPTRCTWRSLRRGYTWRALVHFSGFLGLAKVEPTSGELPCREYRVKALSLLSQFVQFQLLE